MHKKTTLIQIKYGAGIGRGRELNLPPHLQFGLITLLTIYVQSYCNRK